MSSWQITGAMDALMTLAETQVKAQVDAQVDGDALTVTRYMPRQSNLPALWHEKRASAMVPQDTASDRDELYVAVIFAVRHADESAADRRVEEILDIAREVYDTALKERGPLGGVHSARRTAIEAPVPTVINEIPVLAAGVVIRLRLDAYRPQPT